jgi:hypothetical protein
VRIVVHDQQGARIAEQRRHLTRSEGKIDAAVAPAG